MEKHVILNCIEWNRAALAHADDRRNSPHPIIATQGMRDARRYAENISYLQEQLERI